MAVIPSPIADRIIPVLENLFFPFLLLIIPSISPIMFTGYPKRGSIQATKPIIPNTRDVIELPFIFLIGLMFFSKISHPYI